jgi:alpha-D-xyloside xylohydrolase
MRASRILALWCSVLGANMAVPACDGNESDRDASAPDASADAPPSTFGFEVDAAARRIRFVRNRETLVSFEADGFQVGRVDAIDESWNYDPHGFLAAGGPEPAGLAWPAAVSWELREEAGASVVIEITFEGGTVASLELAQTDGEPRFLAKLAPTTGADRIAYLRLRPTVSSEEGFYGLGEYFDHVNHRGQLRSSQLELDLELESSYNEAHVPVPFVTGTNGWGIFAETRYPATFDVAKTVEDRIDVMVATGAASADGLRFHVFLADHPLDVTRHYYEVTGYPRKPARWALGPWVWRDENRDQAEVESDLTIMRDLDLPTTGIWIDRPYATAVNTFDFDSIRFPDPRAMIDLAHDLGFRMALWHVPYVGEKGGNPATATLEAEALTGGFYPPVSSIVFNNWGLPLDFTNPAATTWWQGLLGRYTSMGIEGFKLDYAEDVVVGFANSRTVWGFSDGSDERTMHAEYTLLYHETYADMLPEDGGFLLCRAGTWGDQKHATVIWPGDLDASFAKHRETLSNDGNSYVAVGGLPASIVAGLSLGPSGFPLFGADTGGYRHSPPDEETFRRWFEQTALSTVMQIGTSTNEVAWEWEQKGWSAETLESYRAYTRLHLRLWPYVWTYLERLHADGRPIQRALGLAHPELGAHPDDVYLLGDWLLVAPVVNRGATTREVPLPEGTWVDWWSGARYAGSTTIVVDAPLGRLPLFVREGALVPMLRPTIDTIAPTIAPDRVDSFATTPGALWTRTTLGGEAARFDVFDGTRITRTPQGEGHRFRIQEGAEFTDGIVLEIFAFGSAPPASVEIGSVPVPEVANVEDATRSGWAFDASAGGSLWIRLEPGDGEVVVVP